MSERDYVVGLKPLENDPTIYLKVTVNHSNYFGSISCISDYCEIELVVPSDDLGVVDGFISEVQKDGFTLETWLSPLTAIDIGTESACVKYVTYAIEKGIIPTTDYEIVSIIDTDAGERLDEEREERDLDNVYLTLIVLKAV